MIPIYTVRNEILKAVAENQVVIVVGETGSGKTTKIPEFLYQAGYAEKGMIGVTEPRRIAATSVPQFIASQMGTSLGELVGYHVRFDVQVKHDTAIKFMTDGILLREIQRDRNLSKYAVIMVDEAHERTQNIDFCLGLLKDLLKHRSDLKVIVASATIDAEKFSRYFDGAPVITVSGRTYPVEIKYQENNIDIFDERGKLTMEYMVEKVVNQITSIHHSEQLGDILVFMTGKDDVDLVIERLTNKRCQNLLTLPIYGGLTFEEQNRVFRLYPRQRKVIVATNIAETSITIDGVAYVIDCGYIKQTHFHSESGIQSLDIVEHSQAGCNQRSGRAGRTQPGICYRMYTESNLATRCLFTVPEIRRVSIAGVVLAMEDIGITNIEDFDFLDAPEKEAFHEAYQTLTTLGAIEYGKNGITTLGRQMARLPLDPRIGRMVLEAEKYGCVIEVATIAAFLSAKQVFVRPIGKEAEAEQAHAQFRDERSDALGYLKIWKEYVASSYNSSWCFLNFLNARSLGEIEKVREQLLNVLKQSGIALSETEDVMVVLRSVTAGLIYNLFEYSSHHAYEAVFRETGMEDFFIHPGSALFGQWGTRWVVAVEAVKTTKSYLRCCTKVKVGWLRELLPHYFTEEIHLDNFSEDHQMINGHKTILFNKEGKRTEIEHKEMTFLLEEVKKFPDVTLHEEVRLERLSKDGTSVIGSKIITLTHKGSKIQACQNEIVFTPEEAKKIQDKTLKEVLGNGLLKLTFTREVTARYGSYFETEDRRYRTRSSTEAQLGHTYCCEVEMIQGSWYARPKFQVFNPQPPEPPKRDLASREELEALAAKWNHR